jgi:hypothetical protein
VTVIDDWTAWIQTQINNAEAWAQQNPIVAGAIIVTVSGIVIVAASKAFDAWMKG